MTIISDPVKCNRRCLRAEEEEDEMRRSQMESMGSLKRMRAQIEYYSKNREIKINMIQLMGAIERQKSEED